MVSEEEEEIDEQSEIESRDGEWTIDPGGVQLLDGQHFNQTPEQENDISKYISDMKYRAMSSPW